MTPAPSLHDLISEVHHDAPDDDPLTRLRTAAAMTGALAETSDAVLGYFVDQARRAGHSWSEIGASLGVTKQAAQQRHGGRLGGLPVTFEHFTPRARALVAQCEPLARELGHAHIGTEHLLLAQYSVGEGLGHQILAESGLARETVVDRIVAHVGPGPGAPEGTLPFTSRAVEALTATLVVALELGHNYIGTEHLLLAMTRGDGLAATILAEAGLDEASLRSKVAARLARLGAPATAAEQAAPEKGRAEKAPAKKTPAENTPPKKTPAKKAVTANVAPKRRPGGAAAGRSAHPGLP